MKIIVLCGSPASGKTTLSKKIASEENMTRISMDENGFLQHWELINPIVECLRKNESVIVDALFISKTHRKMLLKAIEEFDCEKIIIYKNVPLEDCLYRNSTRKRKIPKDLLETMYKSIEKPTLDEGWDEIIYI